MTFIDIHTHGYRKKSALTSIMPDELSQLKSGPGYLSMGLHPWSFRQDGKSDPMKPIEEAARNGTIVAIGECGLDRRRSSLEPEQQKMIFLKHIELSEEMKMPLVIHSVHSLADILAFRKKYRKIPWIIHGFMGNTTEILQCQRLNIHLSPGIALLLYKGITEHRLLKDMTSIDPDFLFLETDGVDVDIKAIYSIYSRESGIETGSLSRQTAKNFRRIFPDLPERTDGLDP